MLKGMRETMLEDMSETILKVMLKVSLSFTLMTSTIVMMRAVWVPKKMFKDMLEHQFL